MYTLFSLYICPYFSCISPRVSEQRRKKVQELELQITGLKQKQKEQVKLLRMKEQSEQKVNKLNSEIQVRTVFSGEGHFCFLEKAPEIHICTHTHIYIHPTGPSYQLYHIPSQDP